MQLEEGEQAARPHELVGVEEHEQPAQPHDALHEDCGGATIQFGEARGAMSSTVQMRSTDRRVGEGEGRWGHAGGSTAIGVAPSNSPSSGRTHLVGEV